MRNRAIGVVKRIGVFLTLIVCMAIIVLSNRSKAYTATDGNGLTWYYTVSGGSAYNVYLYSGTVTGDTLVIPNTLGGYPVKGIRGYNTNTNTNSSRSNIINGSYSNNIKKVKIPSTVTSIGNNTFYYFSRMTEIEGLDSVVSIGAYAFCRCEALTEANIPDSLTSIGAGAFSSCESITEINLPNGLTKIEDYTFSGCRKLVDLSIPDSVTSVGEGFISGSGIKNLHIGAGVRTNINIEYLFGNYLSRTLKNITVSENNTAYASLDGVLFNKDFTTIVAYPGGKIGNEYTIPNTVQAIGTYAFRNSNLKIINIPDSVNVIEKNAFRYCEELESIAFPNSVEHIGDYAFEYCSRLKGDLTIPSSVTYMGEGAFSDCGKFYGILTIEPGLTEIPSNAFSGCRFTKVNIGNTVGKINGNAFSGFSDVWIDNTKENVTLENNWGTYTNNSGTKEETYVHWKIHTHYVNINLPEGVKLVNVETNQDVVSGEYECETEFKYKIVVEDGYSYENLKMYETYNNDSTNTTMSEVLKDQTYSFNRLLRSYDITLLDIDSDSSDFALRMFISKINLESKLRAPLAELKNGVCSYKHTKSPIEVKSNDKIEYTIRAYNEGMKEGTVNKISVYIPNGLTFNKDEATNSMYSWVDEGNGKISTTILNEKVITVADNFVNGSLNYKDVPLILSVDKNNSNEIKRLNVIAEIESLSDNDGDSTPGSITRPVSSEYKQAESDSSTETSYIRGQEDDDDFECVLVQSDIVEISYEIKVPTGAYNLVAGASYKLIDENGNEIKTAQENDGNVDFGTVKTIGEGTDIYYIQEQALPEDYIKKGNRATKIKVTVTKTITKSETGYSVNYSYKIVGQDIDFDMKPEAVKYIDIDIDTTNLEFIPIYTAEQLSKIGSGETITIDNEDYVFSYNANYKIMNDINLAEFGDWTPISTPIESVIDGNNCTIANLSINATEDIKEVGLFSLFSGKIKDLSISVKRISAEHWTENATSVSGYSGVGAIAGVASSATLVNCKVMGASITSSNDNVGGLIGHTMGDTLVKGCNSYVPVTANPSSLEMKNNAGGIIGCTKGNICIIESSNNAPINAYYNAGGIVGCTDGSSNLYFEDCTNNVQIQAYRDNAGGIVGSVSDGSPYFIGCTNKAIIKASSNNAGGIIGYIYNGNSYFESCENSNYASALNNAGGMVGFINKDENDSKVESYLKKCTNSGFIEASSNNAGGILGNIYDGDLYFEECTNSGGLRTYNNAGGILGNTRKGDLYVNECANSGVVNIAFNAGGIIGNIYDGDLYLKYCTNSGVIYTAYNGAGGIVGNVYDGDLYFKGCINSGTVKAMYNDAGGVLGGSYNGNSYFIDCTNNEAVTGSSKHAGGIAGKVSNYVYMESGINNGTITNNNTSVGGIIGAINIRTGRPSDIINCTNNGNVTGSVNAGGIIGTSYWTLNVINCINNGSIVGVYRAGGIISELRPLYYGGSYFEDCSNDGIIKTTTTSESRYSAAGIIAEALGYIEIKNCANVADIYGNYNSSGGIIGILCGGMICDNCTNEGSLDSSKGSIPICNAGGILGKAIIIDYTVKVWDGEKYNNFPTVSIDWINIEINNCTNKGNIISNCHLGGIVGMVAANHIGITNCNTSEVDIIDNRYADRGGIIGLCHARYVNFDNCNVDSVEFSITGSSEAYTYGKTGGIVGNIDSRWDGGSSWPASIEIANVNITNCNVVNSNITTCQDEIGGIIGIQSGYVVENGKTNIYNCRVSGCEMEIKSGSTYINIGGIMGTMFGYSSGNYLLEIDKCVVEDCNMNMLSTGGNTSVGGIIGLAYGKCGCIFNNNIANKISIKNKSTGGCNNTGGIIGFIIYAKSVSVNSCDVKDSNIFSVTGNQGGIVGAICEASNKVYFDNCNVLRCDLKENNTSSNPNQGLAGILGALLSSFDIEINCCVVQDSSMKNSETVGGMIGYTSGGTTKVINSKVCNVEMVGIPNARSYYSGLGGIYAAGLGAVIIDGTQVDNCYIHSDGVEINTGGMIGRAHYSSKITNSSVTNSRIEKNAGNNEYSSSKGVVAGVVANCGGSLYLNNCNVKDTKVKSLDKIASGFVGFTQNSVNATNCYGENIDVDCGDYENEYDRGYDDGMTGFLAIGSCNLNDIHLKNIRLNGPIANVGGMCGYVSTLSGLQNCSVDGLEINVLDKKKYNDSDNHVAGMCGAIYSIECDSISNNTVSNVFMNVNTQLASGMFGSMGYATLENCIADNINIKNNNEAYILSGTKQANLVGGMLGYSGTDFNIKNCTVKNSNLDVEYGVYTLATAVALRIPVHVGGVIGYTSGEINAEDVHLEKTSINNKSAQGVTGGIISMTSSYRNNNEEIVGRTLNINNSSIKDCQILGKLHVGGILGFGKVLSDTITILDTTIEGLGPVNIDDLSGIITILDATVEGYRPANSNDLADIGGIIGNSLPESSITNVIANNIIVKGLMRAGGISGINKGTITNSEVNNSTVETTKSNSQTGGITAHNAPEGSVSDSNIEDSEVTSNKGTTGGISGYSNKKDLNCEVINTTVTTTGGGIFGVT